jgi:hypothetical protein
MHHRFDRLYSSMVSAALDKADRLWLSTTLIENGPIRTGRAARLKVTVNLNRQADLGAGR